MQREMAQLLADLLAGVPAARLSTSPAPGKWSILEIVAHLAEDELVTSWRYRQMIENPGAALPGFDQDLWAKVGRYSAWTLDEALSMFRLLREANLRMLDHLTEQQWECGGIHAERGPITVRVLARYMAGHDRNHPDQIRNLLA
jgi:hypothetical protein